MNTFDPNKHSNEAVLSEALNISRVLLRNALNMQTKIQLSRPHLERRQVYLEILIGRA